uniref:Uncharacterized protein n=1 Tax=Chromera velia CCMP2878 TaxID=1169474 RepID=A0A0G4GMI9_9ALVE|eukprot:Cvel_22557.t1-p1 / transcript=Cvel_22557.t1 / gene=Cvel_22557 / organism=Chromera_velia_CCMP2878 / gene_product=hypothetical protein / transcript_product=hypothetical protein / location=Cvel_scaffold2228:1127-7817(-) / protein_length=91 / sequence_SO=supercontig / SO=protein_coding / is_pseudo=false
MRCRMAVKENGRLDATLLWQNSFLGGQEGVEWGMGMPQLMEGCSCDSLGCNTINSRNECQGVARYAEYRTGSFSSSPQTFSVLQSFLLQTA